MFHRIEGRKNRCLNFVTNAPNIALGGSTGASVGGAVGAAIGALGGPCYVADREPRESAELRVLWLVCSGTEGAAYEDRDTGYMI